MKLALEATFSAGATPIFGTLRWPLIKTRLSQAL